MAQDIRTTYHTHTWRCKHASGTEEDYIRRAIEAGVSELGFSDHSPYPMPDGYCSGFRMSCDQTREYVETLLDLREKYKNRIKILIGFEAEYYPKFFGDYLKHIEPYAYDYIIMGQHFIGNEIDPGSVGSFGETDSVEILKRFTDQVCEGIRTGAFSYIAHPDVLHYVGDPEPYREQMTRLCQTAKECNVPLEINGLGIRTHRHYPNPLFWEAAGQVGNEVIYGCDAHDAPNAWDEPSWLAAQKMAADLGLRLLPRLNPHRAPKA